MTRGGAQKIVKQVQSITGGKVLCLGDSRFNFKLFALIELYFIVFKSPSKSKVVAHSRMFLPLVFLLKLLGRTTWFYLHATYRSKPWLFKLFKVGRYIAVSESAKAYLIQQGINKSKIDVVYNPIISKTKQIDDNVIFDTQLRINNGLKNQVEQGCIKVFSVGSLNVWKGFDEAILGLAEVADKLDIRIEYTLIGEGPERDNLQNQVTKLKSKRLAINFTGYSDNPYEHVQDHYIQIIPSLEEGFGLTMVEGIVNNKIIFYRQIPSLVEVANNDPFCFGFDQTKELISQITALYLNENINFDKNILNKRKRLVELKFSYDKFVSYINDTLVSKNNPKL